MILSDVDIRKAIASGDLRLEPFAETQLKPTCYTVTLAEKLLVPKADPDAIIDPENPQFTYDEVLIGDDGYVVQPGEFILGSVAEKISLSTKLCARFDARTTLARIGLNALQGSLHIDPCQQTSHQTLEISNIGPRPIRLSAGMKIAKLIFYALQTEAAQSYCGRFAGQRDGRIPPK